MPILIFTCIALGVLIGGIITNASSKSLSLKNNQKTKLYKLIDFIDKEYVDNVQTDSIVDKTVTNILAELDPHSVYVPAQEQKAIAESMRGNFVGIGINFYRLNDTIAVIKPIPNGPAQKAGIQAGDRLLYANNKPLFGKKIADDKVFSMLKGEANSEVVLTVYRKSENKTFKTKIIRNIVPINSVDIATTIDNVGYIKINRFAETTATEFKKGLNQLLQQPISCLLIDVRNNGGGYLEKAIEIADELLKSKELIVFTKNKKGTINKTYATDKGGFENGKVYILIDENSASASEVLAGAIQDNDRGIVVGRRSFGKGLVQREMDFEDGSAVRLTIARYYTPSGRSIQKPYTKGKSDAYFNEFETRFNSGELYEKDKIKVADSLKFKTKNGRVVYGGGGIVPDIFVPLETSHAKENLYYLLQSGITGQFAFRYIDNHRKQWKKSIAKDVLNKIEKENFVPDFEKFLSKNGLDISLKNNSQLVNQYIIAEIVRQLYGEPYYYKLTLKNDAMIQAVFKHLKFVSAKNTSIP
ncbi:carboxyl-terminal processing protease [Flavobacterium croceum DSM 17960]|uniref:Carboxyl-terminal processing protease n=2 Tax=Flavobacterium TaxID=237 RepID=A0A2S4N6A8_9FLAO|nr:carboxyl-terminal processing protease [Flavobacterium croceum DSM 17960]